MITFFKNQKDLAEGIKKAVDDYWKLEITEPDLIEYLKQVYENNADKILKNDEITSVLKQRLGKKRLELIIKVLNIRVEEEADNGNENN